jgi:hypothetical protein
MPTGAVRISWGAPVAGREAKGLEVFGAALERFEELAKSGRIHSHKEYFSLTGPSGGMMMIEGEVDELMKMLAEPETIALNSKAEAITQDFTITLYGGGTDKAVQDLMGTYMTAMQETGYL